jgi:2-hydroxycyclohexanecarboxyl-CoA dehydrogenase
MAGDQHEGRMAERRAIITGGARGIGRAVAELFLREGARIALIDWDEEILQQTARELSTAGVTVPWCCADVTNEASIRTAVADFAGALGGLDTLINNAAARAFGPLADATTEEWKRILDVNVLGLSNVTKASIPFLRASDRSAIVNVSSIFGIAGRSNMGLYDATKAAILSLTRVWACEEAKNGVRVNAVCPSSTLTPWTVGRAKARGMSVEELKRSGAVPCLLERWAEAEEVAYPVLWLASHEASFMTGVALPVDGGLTAV